MFFQRRIRLNADHYVSDFFIPSAGWHKTQVRRTDRSLIHADNARPHSVKMSLDFLEQNGMKKHLTHRIHLI
jgi:hypothetical protein